MSRDLPTDDLRFVSSEPNEFEARSLEEALRAEFVGFYGIGAKKRIEYQETLWPDFVKRTRAKIRLELLGEEQESKPCPK